MKALYQTLQERQISPVTVFPRHKKQAYALEPNREGGKTTKSAVMTSVELTNRGCTVREEKAKVEKWMQWIQPQFHEEGDATLGHLGVRGFDGGALPILDHENAERQGDKGREEIARVFL